MQLATEQFSDIRAILSRFEKLRLDGRRQDVKALAIGAIDALALGTQPILFMYIPGWPKNEDALYYLKRDTVVPDLSSQDAVLEAVRKHGAIRVVTEEQHAAALQANAGLVVGRLQEFRQPGRKHLFLLSVQEQTSARVL